MTGSSDPNNPIEPSDSTASDLTPWDSAVESSHLPLLAPDESVLPPAAEVEPETEELAYKTSAATPSNLAEFLAAQRGEDSSFSLEEDYQTSTTEPDWSSYSMAPLEDLPPEEEKPSSWKTALAVLREVGETIILTLIIFFLIQTVIRNFRVVGTSMVNNLHDGQYLIIDKLTYNPWLSQYLGVGGPQRGDVIVFEPPNRPGEDYVKRIIGLPGETVEIRQGQVFINGQRLAEPFQPNPGTYTARPVVVPSNNVFVLGDNRNNSNDSHNWGPLPIEKIVGRAWISYWPPNEWGIIPRDKPTEQATLKHFVNELVPQANAGSE